MAMLYVLNGLIFHFLDHAQPQIGNIIYRIELWTTTLAPPPTSSPTGLVRSVWAESAAAAALSPVRPSRSASVRSALPGGAAESVAAAAVSAYVFIEQMTYGESRGREGDMQGDPANHAKRMRR